MSTRLLFSNGVLVSQRSEAPPVSVFLESHPGAYTTTRTNHHNNNNNTARLLFWDRHLLRLANSARILFTSKPQFLFHNNPPPSQQQQLPPNWESTLTHLVNHSMNHVLPVALNELNRTDVEEELAFTTLVTADFNEIENGHVFHVFVHVGSYAVPSFLGNAAKLAVVGRSRDVATAKYSDWVRLRKPLENLRSPSVTELLLSNDGDQILEGCLTNFFVVSRKDYNGDEDRDLHHYENKCSFEVQTAPISHGVLPGIIRQLVIEVCSSLGIPLREVAPSWSGRELWEEAFVTNSLRVIQYVETIQVPSSWNLVESKHWNEISWDVKELKEGPGTITRIIQEICDMFFNFGSRKRSWRGQTRKLRYHEVHLRNRMLGQIEGKFLVRPSEHAHYFINSGED
ncbi:hypothetical protein ACFE04_017780 [Oxalis oulophora]